MSPKLREAVRRRAEFRCEYCRLPESAVDETFPVDHVVARKHRGRTVMQNLALACLRCNVHKGSDLTGIDPADGTVVRLFDPRSDAWAQHFAVNDAATIIGITPTGRTTVALLRMNTVERVLLRREVLLDGGGFG
jgi:5-methylcytosine-specific restriction endonuclease McrA